VSNADLMSDVGRIPALPSESVAFWLSGQYLESAAISDSGSVTKSNDLLLSDSDGQSAVSISCCGSECVLFSLSSVVADLTTLGLTYRNVQSAAPFPIRFQCLTGFHVGQGLVIR
jgi:hypothetical protein